MKNKVFRTLMKKTSQASSEFLIILSVIIIITIISVAVINPSSIFNFSEKSSRDYWAKAPISLRVSVNDSKTKLTIQNNLRAPINVTNIYLGRTNVSITPTLIDSGELTHLYSDVIVLDGTYQVNVTYLLGGLSYYFIGNNVDLTVN